MQKLSQTPKQLKKIQGELVYLDRQYTRMKIEERKADTRQKIKLGGLVKKAKLESESTAVLYGMLLEAAENLSQEDAEKFRAQWKIKGDLALTVETK